MAVPWPFDRATADVVLERIAQGGPRSALAHVLEDDDTLPGVTTWFKWMREHDQLAKDYAHACHVRSEVKHAEIEQIADTPLIGEKEKITKDGIEITRGDMIEHRRLQIDTRKWSMAHENPKKYAERSYNHVEHSGSIDMRDVPDDDLMSELIELLATGRLKLPEGVELQESDDEADDPHGVG